MSIEQKDIQQLNGKLDDIKKLLQQMVAIQLYNSGVSQDEIRQKLGINMNTVNSMLKGVKKEG
ncbi:MAG: hypothetical protein PVF83_06510 [Anaerolineales bacterium]|jgi:DNA-binding transcriptional regulator LsrR (DeoR family)